MSTLKKTKGQEDWAVGGEAEAAIYTSDSEVRWGAMWTETEDGQGVSHALKRAEHSGRGDSSTEPLRWGCIWSVSGQPGDSRS